MFLSYSNDSESIPVIAAGAIFNCEHDGSIYMWEHQQFRMAEIHSHPVCIIEAISPGNFSDLQCKREFHNRKQENIIAQEVAELIGMGLQNYSSENPSISAKDEVCLPLILPLTFIDLSPLLPSHNIPSLIRHHS